MDGLEQDLRGQLRVIRLEVNSQAGQELGQRWGAGFTPTFILFDGAGREVRRSLGELDPKAVRAALGK